MREAIARHWYIIFGSHNFSKSNKFNISPFYKQRLFSIAFFALLKNYREAQESMKAGKEPEVPMALVSKMLIPICSDSSYELYKDHINELIPLIMYSLSLEDEQIKDICLRMVKRLLEQKDHKGLNTEELISTLINSLSVKMSTHSKNLTLICMTLILTSPTGNMLKFKKQLLS